MMRDNSYVFALSYAERMKEKGFIKDILKRYDQNALVGAGIYVNNNPYNLEMILHLNFEREAEDFEKWLSERYKSKKRIFNYFIDDIFESFSNKGYNVATFIDEETVDEHITSEANHIFLHPDRALMNSIWGGGVAGHNYMVFLSHSSKDKGIVDSIFNEVQKNEIKAWYDKYEIEPGDSVTDRINEGLEKSDMGVICISRNFLDSPSGWTRSELNYFIQKRMREGKANFICLNLDVPHDELPPLIQDYRYIDLRSEGAISELIGILKKKANNNAFK